MNKTKKTLSLVSLLAGATMIAAPFAFQTKDNVAEQQITEHVTSQEFINYFAHRNYRTDGSIMYGEHVLSAKKVKASDFNTFGYTFDVAETTEIVFEPYISNEFMKGDATNEERGKNNSLYGIAFKMYLTKPISGYPTQADQANFNILMESSSLLAHDVAGGETPQVLETAQGASTYFSDQDNVYTAEFTSANKYETVGFELQFRDNSTPEGQIPVTTISDLGTITAEMIEQKLQTREAPDFSASVTETNIANNVKAVYDQQRGSFNFKDLFVSGEFANKYNSIIIGDINNQKSWLDIEYEVVIEDSSFPQYNKTYFNTERLLLYGHEYIKTNHTFRANAGDQGVVRLNNIAKGAYVYDDVSKKPVIAYVDGINSTELNTTITLTGKYDFSFSYQGSDTRYEVPMKTEFFYEEYNATSTGNYIWIGIGGAIIAGAVGIAGYGLYRRKKV